jgi:hypothetical protein
LRRRTAWGSIAENFDSAIWFNQRTDPVLDNTRQSRNHSLKRINGKGKTYETSYLCIYRDPVDAGRLR